MLSSYGSDYDLEPDAMLLLLIKIEVWFFSFTLYFLYPLLSLSFLLIFFYQSIYYNVIESSNVLLRRSIFLLHYLQTNKQQRNGATASAVMCFKCCIRHAAPFVA